MLGLQILWRFSIPTKAGSGEGERNPRLLGEEPLPGSAVVVGVLPRVDMTGIGVNRELNGFAARSLESFDKFLGLLDGDRSISLTMKRPNWGLAGLF